MLINSNTRSTYPFVTGCSTEVSEGLHLSPGVISDCLLYPPCGKINYARIGYIGRRYVEDAEARILVVSDTGELLCSVNFDITKDYSNSGVIGYAEDAAGRRCGVICATKELIPLLKSNYYVRDSRSLVFTPSVVRPTVASNQLGKLLTAKGQIITAINFNSTDFKDTSGVVSPAYSVNTEAADRVPIKRIKVNGATAEGKYINLLAEVGSSIRVVEDRDQIVMGGYRDL